MQLQAGTVMGGMLLVSSPNVPESMSRLKFGRCSTQ
jgi:hypothetical protein